MATSEEILNQYGNTYSYVDRNVRFKDLEFSQLEKELASAQKSFKEYDKAVSKAPQFSLAASRAISQRDLSIGAILSLSVIMVSKAQSYKRLIEGPILDSERKELALVNKYKKFDLNSAVETTNAFRAAKLGRGEGMNPIGAQVYPAFKKGNFFIPASPAGAQGVTGPTAPTAPMGPYRPTAPTAPAAPTAPTAPAGPTAPAAPTAPTAPVTPVVTGKVTGLKTGEVLFDGKKVKVGGSKWQQIIQDEFGSMWDVYNDNPEVKKVIDLSVKEGWYNDETKLTGRLQNTNWFRTTQSATRQYNIKKSTDPASLEADINNGIEDTRALSLKAGSGVVLADSTLRMLTESKIKFGWSDQQLLNAIGSEAIATAQGGAQGIASLRQGTVAAGLRESADNYAQKIAPAMLDMWTQEILKGTKTETQFTDLMKMQASQQYRSLAPQIEKDQTVKEAVTMYSNAAENVLGIDPSTIDWTLDKWNKALNYKDPKTNDYRTMDSSEWNRHLRSLPEWKKTDDAKNAYRNLALTLASGFGKTL